MSQNHGPRSHIWPFFGAVLLLLSASLFFQSQRAEQVTGFIAQTPKHGPMTPAQGYATSALTAAIGIAMLGRWFQVVWCPVCISKITSAGIVGVFAGGFVHLQQMERLQMGREAFLARQASRWDFQFAHPESILSDVIQGLVLLGICLALYELLAFAVLKLIKRMDAERH